MNREDDVRGVNSERINSIKKTMAHLEESNGKHMEYGEALERMEEEEEDGEVKRYLFWWGRAVREGGHSC